MGTMSKEQRKQTLAGSQKGAYSEDAMALRIRALSDHAGEEDEKMNVLIDQNEYFKKVMNKYRYFVADEQARLAYEARQKFLHDQASYIADARDEGRKEGPL